MSKSKSKKNNKGFTLVELLVVIAIIGILAIVAVPALFKNIEKGKVADLEADISAIRSATLSYYADNSAYPAPATLDKETVPTDGIEKELYSELEGLSFPFEGSYSLTQDGEDLILEIITTKQISESGKNKLVKDLGNKVIEKDTSIKISLIGK